MYIYVQNNAKQTKTKFVSLLIAMINNFYYYAKNYFKKFQQSLIILKNYGKNNL